VRIETVAVASVVLIALHICARVILLVIGFSRYISRSFFEAPDYVIFAAFKGFAQEFAGFIATLRNGSANQERICAMSTRP
jgi:hypothetical protein